MDEGIGGLAVRGIGMDTETPTKLRTDALVAAIWGHAALQASEPVGPELREMQNQALSLAIRSYLQSYLDDMPKAAANT